MKPELLHATRHERPQSALSPSPPSPEFRPNVTATGAEPPPPPANASAEELPENEGFEVCESRPVDPTEARSFPTSSSAPPAHDAYVNTQEPPEGAPLKAALLSRVAPDTTHDPLPVTRSRPKTWSPTLPPEEVVLPSPGERIGHYEVIRELGRF